jgi:hypothetical protein
MGTKTDRLSPWTRFEKMVKRAVFKLKPGFGAFDYPMFARVTKCNLGGGSVSYKSKGLSVDLQPLNKNLSDNLNFPPIIDVAIPLQSFGNNGACVAIPKVGAIVRLAFMYSDPSMPYITEVCAEKQKTNSTPANVYRIQIEGGAIFEFGADGIKIKTQDYNFNLNFLIDLIVSLSDEVSSASDAAVPQDGGKMALSTLSSLLAPWKTQLQGEVLS